MATPIRSPHQSGFRLVVLGKEQMGSLPKDRTRFVPSRRRNERRHEIPKRGTRYMDFSVQGKSDITLLTNLNIH